MLCCSVPVSIYQAIWTFRKYFTGLVRRVDLRSTYSYCSIFAFSFAERQIKTNKSHEIFLYQVKSNLGSNFLTCPNPKPNPNPST